MGRSNFSVDGGSVTGCVMATSVWGPMLLPMGDEYVTQAILVDGVYSSVEFNQWAQYLAYGQTVVEVGTHCGAHTLALARAVGHRGRVIGYDAQMGMAQMANGTLAMNGMWHAFVHHKAVGASSGVIRMVRRNYLARGNYGGLEAKDEGAGDQVPMTTLDFEAIPQCDFLKIDVEGMEYPVLAGAKMMIRRCRPVICVEADRQEGNVKVFPWLRQMGYRLFWQIPPLGSCHDGITVVNALCIPSDTEPPNGLREIAQGEVWPVKS